MKLGIFCFGNSARGDDAAGEIVHQWLNTMLELNDPPFNQHQITLLYDFQLQPEHIYDLEQSELNVFIDCQHPPNQHDHTDDPPHGNPQDNPHDNPHDNPQDNIGVRWQPLQPAGQTTYSTHNLNPESLLYLYEKCLEKEAPPCFMLAIEGQQFELGSQPSHLMRANIEQAKQLLITKLAQL